MSSVLCQCHELGLKIIELQSKFKKPSLKKVKISAEMMLSVLLGSKHKETIDFKSNLKTVKKAEEKVRLVHAQSVVLRHDVYLLLLVILRYYHRQ
jgi:hypothetical protein